MLVPASVALVIIVLIPTAITIWLSLLNVNVHTLHEWLGAPFYGLQNFVNAFTQPSTLGVTLGWSIFVSFAFSLLTTVVITPIGILAAFSVHRRFRGRAFVRAVYLIPYTIPTFVTALTARVVFLQGSGLVDKILGGIGITNGQTYWLIGPNAYWAMQLTEIWATWPFIYLMVLAGLQSIPKEHYEASALDGATKAQRIRHVIIPELSGVLKLAMLLSTLFHFGNFTLAFVMFGSPPPPGAEVLPIAAYYNAFSYFNFGVAAAIAVVTVVILMVPAYIYMRSTRLAGGLR
jgi:multiple sugar transport system permease protein